MQTALPVLAVAVLVGAAIALLVRDRRQQQRLRLRIKKLYASQLFEDMLPLLQACRKRPLEQHRICKEVLDSCRRNEPISKLVKGFMIESYLEDGNQPVDGGVFGKSITDPCLGWEKTDYLIHEIADRI